MQKVNYATGLYIIVLCKLVYELVLPGGVMAWPSYCPGSCTCGMQTSSSSQQEHRTILCTGEGLTLPPANMSTDVETLVLSANRIHLDSLNLLLDYANLSELIVTQNHIYGLGDVAVTLPSLLYLDVNGNELDYLPNKSFWWVPNLKRLLARNNKIELMDAQAFAGLHYLTSLDLTGNRLFAVIPEWFRDLGHLVDLNLSKNNIHVLREESFRLLVSLRSLDLSYNQLQHVYDSAFKGLHSLTTITLQGNSIKTFPLISLQFVPTLRLINLNHNPIPSLQQNTVANLNVSTLLLSHMDVLTFIDRHAFVNLTSLTRLELTNNRILNYIDPEAFHNLPELKSLFLHSNNLSVIEEDMFVHLASLETVTLNRNSLFCDCNLWWLIDEMNDHRKNLTLPDSDSLACDAPSVMKGTKLSDIDSSGMTRTCAPRILPLFYQEYKLDLGDPVRLNCRSVGRPTPQTDWLLPARHSGSDNPGVMVLKTGEREGAGVRQIDEHISISLAGTLIVQYAQGPDAGDYTCLASNPHGRDERTARVQVKTNLANIIILGMTSHSITVTWRSRSFHHQYQILYKQSNSNDTYHSIDIEPYMRSFTANRLNPATRYEFCMAMQQGQNTVHINCTSVTTRRTDHTNAGLFNARNYIIGGSAACLILVIVVTCVVSYFIKKYNMRKRAEEELYSDNMSQLFLASMDSMSDTTPITYENRGAEMFDDDDIDEIRSTASMPSCSSTHTTVIK